MVISFTLEAVARSGLLEVEYLVGITATLIYRRA